MGTRVVVSTTRHTGKRDGSVIPAIIRTRCCVHTHRLSTSRASPNLCIHEFSGLPRQLPWRINGCLRILGLLDESNSTSTVLRNETSRRLRGGVLLLGGEHCEPMLAELHISKAIAVRIFCRFHFHKEGEYPSSSQISRHISW